MSKKNTFQAADQRADEKIESIKKKAEAKSWRRNMVKNAQGKYVYIGPKYHYPGDKAELKTKVRSSALLSILTLGAVIAAGLLPVPGLTREFYILIPFAVHILTAVLMCWNVILLIWAGNPIPDYEFRGLKRNYPSTAGIGMVSAFLAAAAEGVYLLRHIGEADVLLAVLFIAAEAISGVAFLNIIKIFRSMKWELREGKK